MDVAGLLASGEAGSECRRKAEFGCWYCRRMGRWVGSSISTHLYDTSGFSLSSAWLVTRYGVGSIRYLGSFRVRAP
jgi:hypothetical protein